METTAPLFPKFCAKRGRSVSANFYVSEGPIRYDDVWATGLLLDTSEKKIFLWLPEIELRFLRCSAYSLVTTPTTPHLCNTHFERDK